MLEKKSQRKKPAKGQKVFKNIAIMPNTTNSHLLPLK